MAPAGVNLCGCAHHDPIDYPSDLTTRDTVLLKDLFF